MIVISMIAFVYFILTNYVAYKSETWPINYKNVQMEESGYVTPEGELNGFLRYMVFMYYREIPAMFSFTDIIKIYINVLFFNSIYPFKATQSRHRLHIQTWYV